MFAAAGIEPEARMDSEERAARGCFQPSAGILKTMDIPDTGYTCLTEDGTDNCRARAGRHRRRQSAPLLHRDERVRGQLHRRSGDGEI
jgi:hypothetical protein